MRVSLVILTLNEIDGLRALYDRIPLSIVEEVVAVDGGSTDGTLEFFTERKCKVIQQTSRGRGEAFRIACDVSSGDAVIFFSPDGNEDPNDISKFLDHVNNGSGLVVASRFLPEAHNEEDEQTFKWRKWANQIFTLFANIIWNKKKHLKEKNCLA